MGQHVNNHILVSPMYRIKVGCMYYIKTVKGGKIREMMRANMYLIKKKQAKIARTTILTMYTIKKKRQDTK